MLPRELTDLQYTVVWLAVLACWFLCGVAVEILVERRRAERSRKRRRLHLDPPAEQP